MTRRPFDDAAQATAHDHLDVGDASPLEQITTIAGLLFETGLALNSIQQSSQSEHDSRSTAHAVTTLDNAVRRLRGLGVSLTSLDALGAPAIETLDAHT